MSGARGKNEGAVDLSYKPPIGFKKLTSSDEECIEAGFEWDNINHNPDLDIWVVRIPAELKASDLVGLKLKLPSGSKADVTGKLKKDGVDFVLNTVGGDTAFGAGEEMQNMRCLIPKADEDGALYTILRPLKPLVLTRQEPLPTPSAAPTASAQPQRRAQPFDRLKHTFMPIGALPLSTPKSWSPNPMDVDESPKKKRKKQGGTEDNKAETPKAKSKSKNRAITGADEKMEIDEAGPVTPITPKRSKKKSAIATDDQLQDVEASVKKEKRKRKTSED